MDTIYPNSGCKFELIFKVFDLIIDKIKIKNLPEGRFCKVRFSFVKKNKNYIQNN